MNHPCFNILLDIIIAHVYDIFLGPVNAILSWKVWAPIAKLNYTAYLVHPNVIRFLNSQRRTPLHFDYISMVSSR